MSCRLVLFGFSQLKSKSSLVSDRIQGMTGVRLDSCACEVVETMNLKDDFHLHEANAWRRALAARVLSSATREQCESHSMSLNTVTERTQVE